MESSMDQDLSMAENIFRTWVIAEIDYVYG